MSRFITINPESATGKTKDLFDSINTKLGMVPNMMRVMANAPAVLEGYLQLSGTLGKGSLPAKAREQIALAVSQANECDYCLAAHSAIGKMVGLSADQIRDSRLGAAVDPKIDALIRFARKLVDNRGQVSNEDVQDVRAAGFEDGVIAEVVANVALSIFTNYFNNVAETDIDFPKAPPLKAPALITTPECWVPALGSPEHGFPLLSGAGRLVIKDAIMAGAALVTMADSAKVYLRRVAAPHTVSERELALTTH
jgi:uncharacterized peroxidase-related enzyme